MSFRCEFCGFPQAIGVSPTKLVTKKRKRGGGGAYEAVGTEIAEEKNACSACAEEVGKEAVEMVGLPPEPVLDVIEDPSFA